MNFSELKAEVFRRLYTDDGAPVYWSEQDVEDALNEGYLDYCERTKCCERQTEFVCVGKLPYLDARTLLRYPFISLRRIFSRALQGPLQPSSYPSMDARDKRWEMSTSLARRMSVRGHYTIMLYPVPPSESQFRISWSSLPDPMKFDDDSPDIPIEHHEAPIYYALYDLKVQEDETDLALQFWQKYLDFTASGDIKAKSQIKKSRSFIMGVRYNA